MTRAEIISWACWLGMTIAFFVMYRTASGWRKEALKWKAIARDRGDFIDWLGEYFARHIDARRTLNDQLRKKLDEHYAAIAARKGPSKDVN